MNKSKKFFIIIAVVLFVVIAGSVAFVVSRNAANAEHNNTQKTLASASQTSGTSEAASTEPITTEQSKKDDMRSILIGNVWEHKIQDYFTFKFRDDNTGGSYLEDNLQETFDYELNGTTLTITWNTGFQTIMEYITKSENIDWDTPFILEAYDVVDEDEGFFYEVDFEPDEMYMNNAFWMKIKKD